MKGYVLIDGSNIGFANTANKVLKVGEQEVQGFYGFMRWLRPVVAMYPMLKPIVLWDGISWRYDTFPEYKANRDKPPENETQKKMAALRASFRSQRVFMREGLTHLGVTQIHALNLEADDLAAMLVKKHKGSGNKIMLVTGDKDWVQLVGPGVGWYDPTRDMRITEKTIEEKLGFKDKDGNWHGVPSPRAWLEIKALMGDPSDEIPGVGGIGDKGAILFMRQYGSVTKFRNGIMDKSIDPKSLPKKFRELIEDEDKLEIFARNLMLMNLNTSRIPAPNGLTVAKAELDPIAFKAFCERWVFNSILSNPEWLDPFQSAIDQRLAA